MTETWTGIQAIAAPLIIIVLGIVTLLMDLGRSTRGNRILLMVISLAGLTVAMLASAPLVLNPDGPDFSNVGFEPVGVFGQGMLADRFGGLCCIVLCFVAGLSLVMSYDFLEERGINQGEFYALILFATAGSMLMAMSLDLVNIFIGLEILSVALYILSGYLRRDIRSGESAVKYFLLGAFASGFLLYGTALIYGAVGLYAQGNNFGLEGSYTNLYSIGRMVEVTGRTGAPLLASPVFVVGVVLVIVGLGFKASLVPFHFYAPDVYEGAPTGVTAFMSAGAKIGAFAALVRFLSPLSAFAPFEGLIWWLAAATMLFGNIMAVRQTAIKRMLAYSSIAHAGYILVGVLASGIADGATLSRGAVVYYLFAYTFMNLGAFAVVLWLGRNGGEFTDVRNYAGLARQKPLAAFVMSVCLLSLAGFPPAAGFFGKLYIFLGAIQSGYTVLATVGLVASAIGVYYYLNLIATIYFRQPEQDFRTVRGGGAKWAALVAAVATLLLGVVRPGVFAPHLSDPAVAARSHRRPIRAQPAQTVPPAGSEAGQP